MRNRKLPKLIALIILLVIVVISISRAKIDDCYDVILPGIPLLLKADIAQTNVSYYILKQTHEPLFRKDNGENYSSKVLTNWSRNLLNTEFTFCPNTNLSFNENEKFDFNFFSKYIYQTTRKFNINFKIQNLDNCVKITFKNPQNTYLDFLILSENAPTIKRTKNVEDGLGAFMVTEFSNKKIKLKRKERVSDGYNEIIGYSDTDKGIDYNSKTIEDLNLINYKDIPNWVKQEYISFDSSEYRIAALIINNPDKTIRTSVYNCLNIPLFVKSFYNIDYYIERLKPIKTIISGGIPGAVMEFPDQKCDINHKNQLLKKEIYFANWMDNNDENIKKFFADFTNKSGLKVTVFRINDEALMESIYRTKKNYKDLVVTILTANVKNFQTIFDHFFTDKGLYDFQLTEIKPLYAKLAKTNNEQERNKLILKISNKISEGHLMLPLYQRIRKIYYPRKLKDIVVAKGFAEYPEIAEFRW